MKVEEFFQNLVTEIETNSNLQGYYRFGNKDSRFLFRKSYYCQRLQFVVNQLNDTNMRVWDCGCGYGTTGIFLALNGFKVFGTTIEYYFEEINDRHSYWEKFGNTSGFTAKYLNLFDNPPTEGSFDAIILQDVLHHLEPIDDAIDILLNALTPNGKLIVCEENGSNLINSFKLYLRRGNKRIITIKDEVNRKEILLGNENIKPLNSWKQLFANKNAAIDEKNLEYIRLFPPFVFKNDNYNRVISKEQQLWKKYPLLKEYFFFGMNFNVVKI
jgi:2-polyprenyl-3-methyl-5-hydroxy-6-metoxy-1,4-benzoquinol methylase